jgi:PAS domain S-box-containing protein
MTDAQFWQSQSAAKSTRVNLFEMLQLCMEAKLVLDANLHILISNPAVEALFGYTNAELLGRTIDTLIPLGFSPDNNQPPGAFPGVWQMHWPSYKQEVRGKTKTGEILPLLESVFRIFLDDQPALVVTLQDTSALYHAEEARYALAQYLQHMGEETRDVIFSVKIRPKIQFEFLSPSISLYTGYQCDAFLANPDLILHVIHPDDVTVLQNLHPRNNEEIRINIRLIGRDNGLSWLDLQLNSIVNAQAKVINLNGIGRDITARIEAEERSRQNEERLRALINTLPDMIGRFDRQGIILDIHVPVGYGYSLPASQFTGKHLGFLFTSEFAKGMQPLLERTLQTGQIQIAAQVEQTPLGPRTFEMRWMRSGDEEATCIFRDISERTRLEKLKSDFIHRAAHQLRTPLTTAFMMLDLIHDGGTPEEIENYLAILTEELNRQRVLVDEVLDLGVIESGQRGGQVELVQIESFLSTALAEARPAADNRQVRLIAEIAPALPPVYSDYNSLSQILGHLLGNAVKFTLPGGLVLLRATPASRRTTGMLNSASGVEVTISDSGIGIPAEEMPHLFERFFRASNASRLEIPGTGVGLFVVRSLIERIGGNISVSSKINEGTSMTIWFPGHNQQQ